MTPYETVTGKIFATRPSTRTNNTKEIWDVNETQKYLNRALSTGVIPSKAQQLTG
jgi:hypothetical protein